MQQIFLTSERYTAMNSEIKINITEKLGFDRKYQTKLFYCPMLFKKSMKKLRIATFSNL